MAEFRPSPVYRKMRVGDDGSIIGASGKVLTPMVDRKGYQRLSVYLGENRWRRVGVHRLVCETFHGLKPAWAELVAHRNGDRADNRAVNLRWATSAENESDKRAHGRDLTGERHHQAKLTEAQVIEIRRRRAAGEQGRSLAREFGVTESAICSIHNRRSWRYV